MINKELVIEFQEAIKKDYSRDISYEEADSILTDMTVYFSILQKIHNKMTDQ